MVPFTETDAISGDMSTALTFIAHSAFGQKHMTIGKDDAQSKIKNEKRYVGWLCFIVACMITYGVIDYGSITTTSDRSHTYQKPHSAPSNHYTHFHHALSMLVPLLCLYCRGSRTRYWLYFPLLLCALLPTITALPRLETNSNSHQWFKIIHATTGNWYRDNAGSIETYSGGVTSDDKLWKAIHINGIYFRLQNKASGRYLNNPSSSPSTINAYSGTTGTTDESLWYMVPSDDNEFRLKNAQTRRVFGYNGASIYTALYTTDANTLLYFDFGYGVGNANNELCNTDRWKVIHGSWSQNPSTCALTNDVAGAASKVWFGSAAGITPDPLYVDLSFTLRVVIEITSGTDAGIMIRTTAAEGTLDKGPNYFIGLNPDLDKMVFGSQNNGWGLMSNPTAVNHQNFVYELKVITSRDYCDVYLNDTLIINGLYAPNWQTGTIGLRSQNTVTTYHKLVYEPRGTNLLCDNTKWNDIVGTWSFTSSTCVLSNTEVTDTEAKMWFGAADGVTADNDYGGTTFVVKARFEITAGHDAGLMIHCLNAGSGLNAGPFYLVNINPTSDTVTLGIANGGWTVLSWAYPGINYNQIYELTLIVHGLYLDVWLDDDFIFTDLWLSNAPNWDHGSIGFRTYLATTNIYSISMHVRDTESPTPLPTQQPTFPTAYPSKTPTAYPTKRPTAYPTKRPTAYPTKQPTDNPTNHPSKPPTDQPTKQPSITPTKHPTKSPTLQPTAYPTKTPTKQPTNIPTKSPSNAPSIAPSLAPSHSPSMSPTSCLDFGSYNDTKDGTDEWSVLAQTNIDFMYRSPSTILNATEIAAFTTGNIYLNESRNHLVCYGLVSCLQTTIVGTGANDTFFNIECIGELSCNTATLTISGVHHVHVLCKGTEMCKDMVIDIQDIQSKVVIDCVEAQSCTDMVIKLHNNNQNIISCYLLNACDDIAIETTDYANTKLRLYSYSLNIRFDNGYGLTAAKDNVECILPNRYIRYDSTLPNDPSEVMRRVANEYIGNQFACDDNVHIICDQNKTDPIENNCAVSYTVNALSMPVNAPQCFWVSLSELVSLNCLGNCLFSPTEYPTNAPTFSPTIPTIAPTNAPSFSPTIFPSNSPSSPPTNAPSNNPSATPSSPPSQSPSAAPSTAPSLSPSHSPTMEPTMEPTLEPTFNPTLDPTVDPTVNPTMNPTQIPTMDPTNPPSADPTIDPTTEPTVNPTIDPTSDPTHNPTNAPSISPSKTPSQSPSVTPTIAPSIAPSHYPSAAPSIAPSGSPSAPPTTAPSGAPSNVPTLNPTVSPSLAPTISPTSAPTFSPTVNPTIAPTESPTRAPSTPPTFAPSRFPTKDVDEEYDTRIKIEYEVKHLRTNNKYFIAQHTREAVGMFEQFIEKGYFDEGNDFRYTDFWCNIYQMNGKSVSVDATDPDTISANAEAGDETTNEDALITVYDLDILDQNPSKGLILSTAIECDDQDGEFIIKRTGTSVFQDVVQESFREYLNNSDITFTVATSADALQEESKFDTPKEEDKTAIYLSIVIVSAGSIVSLSAFIYNRAGSSKVDNTAFVAPLLVSLGLYDFISDLNFAIQIFKNIDPIEYTMKNIYVWLGILSIIFVVLPFGANLVYAKTINSQKSIRESPSAREWFAAHLGQFILICILCSGTYPVLVLCNSRIFGMEFFEIGLLRSDLQQLSKIKIRSTIFMENCPQILIQVVYAINRNELENATVLAFLASSLSVVASVIIYQAQKDIDDETVIAKYFVRFANLKKTIDEGQEKKIAQKKGYKKHLGKAMCQEFEIDPKSIEIGYITPTNNGCIVRLQHSFGRNKLDLTETQEGVESQMTPELYARNLYATHAAKITDVFRKHFKIDDKDFVVSYHTIYDEAKIANQKSDSVSGVNLESANPELQTNQTNIIDEMISMKKETKGIEMTGFRSGAQPKSKMSSNDQSIVDTFNSLQLQKQMEVLQHLQQLIFENMMSTEDGDGEDEMKEEEKEAEAPTIVYKEFED
eukprot:709977_1